MDLDLQYCLEDDDIVNFQVEAKPQLIQTNKYKQ